MRPWGHKFFVQFSIVTIICAILIGCAQHDTRYESTQRVAPVISPRPEPPSNTFTQTPQKAQGELSVGKAKDYQALIAKGAPWTWIWQYNGSPLKKKADIHVLDAVDHSVEDYRFVRNKGSFPVAYFSCSYEGWRPDAKRWRSSDKGKKMSGWNELWPAPAAIKNHNSNLWSVYEQRLDYFKNKTASITTEPWNFAIEWDNVDLYSSIGLGRKEGLRFLRHLKEITERRGFVFVLKNSVEVINDLPGVQMYVNESAQQWNELHTYRNVGKHVPVLNVEYKKPKQFPSYVYTIYYPNQNKIDGRAITY